MLAMFVSTLQILCEGQSGWRMIWCVGQSGWRMMWWFGGLGYRVRGPVPSGDNGGGNGGGLHSELGSEEGDPAVSTVATDYFCGEGGIPLGGIAGT